VAKIQVLQKFRVAKCLGGAMSGWPKVWCGKKSGWQNVWGGTMSVFIKRQDVLVAKCLGGNMSGWQNVWVAKCPFGNSLVTLADKNPQDSFFNLPIVIASLLTAFGQGFLSDHSETASEDKDKTSRRAASFIC